MTQIITARQALTDQGWQKNIQVTIQGSRIGAIEANQSDEGLVVDVLLPALSNVHSHAFQRAMAGLTEQRGPDPRDSFWTWRKLMYRFLDQLNPDDIEAIAAFVYLQMIEAGYCAVGEFHYLHHQPDGQPYSQIGETSERIAAAATQTGIGLTLLPVLYEFGGCDGRALGPGQRRFGNDPDRFEQLLSAAESTVGTMPTDTRIGVAPHSLRAVNAQGLERVTERAGDRPIHIHLAEQLAEVDEVRELWGATPAQWLLNNTEVKRNWCLIHGTQLTSQELRALAQHQPVIGLCPITEANLGDGIFDARTWRDCDGAFGIGSDSNLRISVTEELRQLEYSQRLRDHKRSVLATNDYSTGRAIYTNAARGGSQALARPGGSIKKGKLADLVALNTNHIDLSFKHGDTLIDSYIFSGDDYAVSDVWSAGRHVLQAGQHAHAHTITARYRHTLSKLLA